MKVWLGEIKKIRDDDYFNTMFAKIFIEIIMSILLHNGTAFSK